jgi:hypothetical protein
MAKVDLCNRFSFGKSFRSYDVEDIDDLKQRLCSDGIKTVGIGYIDIFDDFYEPWDLQSVENLANESFAWLIAEDKNCLRFLFKEDELGV